MKHHSPTIAQETRTTITDVVRWTQELDRLHARIAPRFARPEPRRRALAFLHGILSTISRKNGWQLAEHAREARPDGMQRLLSSAIWDTDGVRDDLRTYALEHLGNQSAIVVIDETSFPKQGKKSAGVGVQYCGTTGQVENCQVGVFLSYVTASGHTPISRDLYLPLDWTEDRERCQAAGIDIRRCASRRNRNWPEACWRVYGMPRYRLPGWWQIRSMEAIWTYAPGWKTMDILTCWRSRGPEPVGIVTPDGVRRRMEAAQVETFLLAAHDWQRLSMSEDRRGPRLFDWASVPMLHRWEDDGCHWVLIRRSLTDPNENAYYFVFAPQGPTLPEMVAASGARWHIEENFENGKDLGLDHYEVRSFTGWYRHITLVLVALADFPGICATERFSISPPAPSPLPARPAVLALTVPEVRHLLAQLIWPSSSSACRVLAWSWWRRCHQSHASYYHTKRRRDQLANPGFFAIFHR